MVMIIVGHIMYCLLYTPCYTHLKCNSSLCMRMCVTSCTSIFPFHNHHNGLRTKLLQSKEKKKTTKVMKLVVSPYVHQSNLLHDQSISKKKFLAENSGQIKKEGINLQLIFDLKPQVKRLLVD